MAAGNSHSELRQKVEWNGLISCREALVALNQVERADREIITIAWMSVVHLQVGLAVWNGIVPKSAEVIIQKSWILPAKHQLCFAHFGWLKFVIDLISAWLNIASNPLRSLVPHNHRSTSLLHWPQKSSCSVQVRGQRVLYSGLIRNFVEPLQLKAVFDVCLRLIFYLFHLPRWQSWKPVLAQLINLLELSTALEARRDNNKPLEAPALSSPFSHQDRLRHPNFFRYAYATTEVKVHEITLSCVLPQALDGTQMVVPE